MIQFSKRAVAGLITLLLVLATSPVFSAPADHVVPSTEIKSKVNDAAAVRQRNIKSVQTFFASPQARHVLKKGKVDYAKVENAIPALSDQELAALATRTNKIQNDFAAGALTNEQLTYIVIALATAVVVILIAKS